jgi:UDP-glucose 4-epimerase
VNVLVTGGMGVNGSAVVRRLLRDGHRPIVFDRHSDPSLIPAAMRADVVMYEGDVTNLEGLEQLLRSERIEVIAHLAALVGPNAEKDPYSAVCINVLGTANLLEAARRAEVRRVVLSSTKAVWGPITGQYAHPSFRPVEESHPIGILPDLKIYCSTKIACEAVGQRYAEAYGIEFAALRFSAIFTVGRGKGKGPAGIHSRILEEAMAGVPVRVAAGGDQADDLIYGDDLAQAMIKACVAPRLNHCLYNIGTGRLLTLRQFGAAVSKILPGADVEVGPGLDYIGRPVYCLMDISRARTDLGFEPEYSIETAVRDYAGLFSELYPC